MKHNIRNWLIVPFIGLFLLPLMVVGGVVSLKNYSGHKEWVIQQQLKITALKAEKISSLFREQQLTLQTQLETNYLPGVSQEKAEEILSLILASVKDRDGYPILNRLSLLNENGYEIVRVDREKIVRKEDLKDLSKSDVFRIPATKMSVYYSPVYFGKETGEPFISLCLPIIDRRVGGVSGVLVAEKNLKSVWQAVAAMSIGQRGNAFITSPNGQVVAHRNRSVVLRETQFIVPAQTAIMKGISNEKSLIAVSPVQMGDQVLNFVTEDPASEAFNHIRLDLILVGTFFLCCLIGSLIFGTIVVRQIAKPIEDLAKLARRISQGDYSQKADLQRGDELGELADAFNTMTSTLFNTISELGYKSDFVKKVIESLTHPFYVINVSDYKIVMANSAAIGGGALNNQTCYQLTHDFDKPCHGEGHPCPVNEILITRKPVVLEHVHQGKSGNNHIVEIYGYPIFDADGEVVQIIEYVIDITEKKDLELQLQQSQKLEAIGTLTGGVAHDFNNLLTIIAGYSQLYLMDHKEDDPDRRPIKLIFEASEKAISLVRQLLAFSRKQVMELKVINVNLLISDLSKMLSRLIGEDIETKRFLNEKIGNIKADPGQIEQIVVNLVVNAKDAMPQGGTLYIESDSVQLDEEYCRTHPDVNPGSYVVLSVTDTGVGMPVEIKNRIFDPFFTTKTEGQGTGLGLATVYGIVKQMHGHIYVYSEPGSGTTFKLYFPEIRTEIEQVKKEKIRMPRGTETILVVDDERSILMLIEDTLQPLGYHVLTASSGNDALEILQDSAEKIDLLLTDVIMRGMNGRETADAIKVIQPDMKVLYMSGYTDNVIAQKGIVKKGINFIPKPILPFMLIGKIRDVLDEVEMDMTAKNEDRIHISE